MSDAPDQQEPTPEAEQATAEPPKVEPAQQVLAVDTAQQAKPAEVAPKPEADPKADPLYRAQIEKAKAEALAEAKRQAAAEREKIEAKIRAEVEAKLKAEAEEAARLEQMDAQERLQHELKKMADADKAKEAAMKLAEEKAKAASERLDFVRAISHSGKRMAKDDPALEELALTKARELVDDGKSMADAIAALTESDPYLFAKPAEAPPKVSTAAGSGAPRASTSTARSPSDPPEFDAMSQTSEKFGAYIAGKGYLEHVTQTSRQVH